MPIGQQTKGSKAAKAAKGGGAASFLPSKHKRGAKAKFSGAPNSRQRQQPTGRLATTFNNLNVETQRYYKKKGPGRLMKKYKPSMPKTLVDDKKYGAIIDRK